jgi:glycosyltransferase involved in cell wall biosynthesis
VVSIIIPCYNIAQHLPTCIQSVLLQTFTDFELLLINDGSTDTTLQICEQFAANDSRIKVFTHQNKGVSYTRNRGIKEAKGEYIMFVDGDDYVERDYIEKHLIDLEENCITLSGFLNEKNGVITKNYNFKRILAGADVKTIQKNDILQLLKHDALSTPCCKLYSLKVIQKENIFFDEGVSYQEDLLFNIAYFSYFNKYKLINYFGYHYVAHDTSSTTRYHVNFDHTNKLFKALVVFVSNSYEKEILKELILQTLLRKISNIFHKNNQDKLIQKNTKVREVYDSEEFQYSKAYVEKLELNFLLKKILQSKYSILLSSYFVFRSQIFK